MGYYVMYKGPATNNQSGRFEQYSRKEHKIKSTALAEVTRARKFDKKYKQKGQYKIVGKNINPRGFGMNMGSQGRGVGFNFGRL